MERRGLGEEMRQSGCKEAGDKAERGMRGGNARTSSEGSACAGGTEGIGKENANH